MTDLDVRPAPEDVERSWKRGHIPRGSAAWLTRWRPVQEPAGWTDDAACRHAPKAVFFSSHPPTVALAKSICRGCPVKDLCLRLNGDEAAGTWGGQTEDERFLSVTDPYA